MESSGGITKHMKRMRYILASVIAFSFLSVFAPSAQAALPGSLTPQGVDQQTIISASTVTIKSDSGKFAGVVFAERNDGALIILTALRATGGQNLTVTTHSGEALHVVGVTPVAGALALLKTSKASGSYDNPAVLFNAPAVGDNFYVVGVGSTVASAKYVTPLTKQYGLKCTCGDNYIGGGVFDTRGDLVAIYTADYTAADTHVSISGVNAAQVAIAARGELLK